MSYDPTITHSDRVAHEIAATLLAQPLLLRQELAPGLTLVSIAHDDPFQRIAIGAIVVVFEFG